jgi:hypothetical protein
MTWSRRAGRSRRRARAGEDLTVGDLGVGVVPAPGTDHIGDVGNLQAEDERQALGLDRPAVRLGDHAGVGDDGDIGQPVRGHERSDHGEHGLGLGLVAFESLGHQREASRVGEQAQGDLWFEAAFLRVAGLAEPIALVSLEIVVDLENRLNL